MRSWVVARLFLAMRNDAVRNGCCFFLPTLDCLDRVMISVVGDRCWEVSVLSLGFVNFY